MTAETSLNPTNSWLNRVLVVEDSLSERFRMVALLKNLGYEVLEASDGNKALTILKDIKAAMILSDWSMPEMSGLELCHQVREGDFDNPYFILVTGRDTTEDLVEGMEAGADDFIRKPFNREELRVRLGAGQRIMQMRDSLEEQNHQLAASIERERHLSRQIRDDLKSAAKMLQEMLPVDTQFGGNLNVAGIFKPAIDIGGDFYNFFKLDSQRIGFYLFDIAGHGIPAALMAFSVARLLSDYAGKEGLLLEQGRVRSPAEVVGELNAILSGCIAESPYLTMIYAILDVESGEGEFCQAGHPNPLLLKENGEIEWLGSSGFPVSLIDSAEYTDTPLKLQSGDKLVLYSDGVTEAENQSGEQLGKERFVELLRSGQKDNLSSLLATVYDEVCVWMSDKDQLDDLTCLMLEWKK